MRLEQWTGDTGPSMRGRGSGRGDKGLRRTRNGHQFGRGSAAPSAPPLPPTLDHALPNSDPTVPHDKPSTPPHPSSRP